MKNILIQNLGGRDKILSVESSFTTFGRKFNKSSYGYFSK